MSDAEKQDLQQFVVNESQKARIQQCKKKKMHTLTHYTSPTIKLFLHPPLLALKKTDTNESGLIERKQTQQFTHSQILVSASA
jgi:hypothetical protein